MQTLPIRYFDEHTNGSVMSLYTNDTDTLRQMINQSIPQVLMASFTVVVTFIAMLVLSPLLTVLAVVMILSLIHILSKNDIVQVIGEYVTLTRKGSRFWASCPWHAERNPSFCVSPDKQMFYCFSCKKGGGVINFIMENEKLSYVEAVSLLAERVGMTLPEETGDEDYQKKKAYRKRLHGLMRELAVYYNHTLKGEEGREALAYMKRRGAAAQIMPFGLGYAKNSFDDALRFLKAQGYTVKEMLDAGVVKQKDGRVYDVFRNRVMFPIQNVFGDVIGFGGRVMDDGIPKYQMCIRDSRHGRACVRAGSS